MSRSGAVSSLFGDCQCHCVRVTVAGTGPVVVTDSDSDTGQWLVPGCIIVANRSRTRRERATENTDLASELPPIICSV